MSWRDKVHAMRDCTNSEIVAALVPPKLPKPGFVGSGSALPLHISEKKEAANYSPPVQAAQLQPDPNQDRDRWCWPHTVAMNSEEIDICTQRLAHFTRHGLAELDADTLADGLVIRDRETDDRRLCLECLHLKSVGGNWSCNQWKRAGLGTSSVPIDLVRQLQRCDSFKEMRL